jgi:HAD superfamily hydrolase (TIGR01457 family)
MLPYTTYLIDLDGVVYRGNEVLPGAREFVQWLEANQKKYLFLTNNSFATSEQILAKLTQMGIVSTTEHLLTAGQAAVQNISHRFPNGRVYVVGESSLLDLVHAYKLHTVPVDSSEADVVLVGLDRFFDYQKLTCATKIVRSGAPFITINRDPLLPISGDLIPGCGSLAAAIESASGVHPEVVGKPEPMLLVEAMRLLGSQPAETVIIGDGLDVDILAGKNAGTHTLFVLSGRNSREDLARSPIQPERVYADLAAVLKDLV